MQRISESVKVELLDYAPNFKTELKDFGPDKIVAASGIATMKKGRFKEMLEGVDEKVLKGFHNEATRRGHASLTTSVNFYFWLEGSRILDFYFTSFQFGSYMMLSSRRMEIGLENMVVPDSIADSAFIVEYERLCKRMVEIYQKIKEETNNVDYARRILPIGFISRGLFNLPLQVVLGVIKEVREDKSAVLPKEIVEISNLLEAQIRNCTSFLAEASLKLPYDTNYPHPNLFKSDVGFQEQAQKTRILLKDENFEKLLDELKFRLKLENEVGGIETQDRRKKSIGKAAEIWKDFVEKIQDKILLEADVTSSLSAWNDIKRHRTARQKVESIYHAVDRCLKNLDESNLAERDWIESNFYIPPVENQELRKEVAEAYKEALQLYEKMVKAGIEKRDAIYVIPHGINLGVKMFLDGYHLFDPFGFVGVRACTTADHEVVAIVNKIIRDLEKDVPGIETLIGPKCKLGYCPERIFCGLVKKFVDGYDESLHATFQ